jgi:predicted DNA-binding transcriptional regulator AlpA
VAAPKVMGLYEIAERLGVSKRYARELAARKGFPDPTRLHMGLVWSAADVDAWIARHRPHLNDPAG